MATVRLILRVWKSWISDSDGGQQVCELRKKQQHLHNFDQLQQGEKVRGRHNHLP